MSMHNSWYQKEWFWNSLISQIKLALVFSYSFLMAKALRRFLIWAYDTHMGQLYS